MEYRLEKCHAFRNTKFTMFLVTLMLLTILTLLFVALSKHLLQIQNIERLDKMKDYSDFKLHLENNLYCYEKSDSLYFENDKIRIYGSCLKVANIYYGNTVSSLKYALEKEYVTLDMLMGDDVVKNEENKAYYNEIDGQKFVIYEYPYENDKTEYFIEAA